MQAHHTLSNFLCPRHPTEPVQRVSLDPANTHPLYCIECLVSGQSSVDTSSLITLSALIDKAQAHYTQHGTPRIISATAPNDLVEFLSQETQALDRLSEHIEKEKTKVTADVDSLTAAFTDLLQQKKHHLHTALDQQLVTMKANYAYYKATIVRFYNQDDQDKAITTREAILEKMSSLQNVEQLDVYVKQIKDDLSDAEVTYRDREIVIKLKDLGEVIAKQTALSPQVKLEGEHGTEWLTHLKEKMAQIVDHHFLGVSNLIPGVTLQTVGKNTPQSKKDPNLLNKLIQNHKDMKLLEAILDNVESKKIKGVAADILSTEEYLLLLIDLAQSSDKYGIEANLILAHSLCLETDSQRNKFMLEQKIEAIINGLSSQKDEVVLQMIKALENVLIIISTTPEAINIYNLIEGLGGLDVIERLQTHHSQEVYEIAVRIIETYFDMGEY